MSHLEFSTLTVLYRFLMFIFWNSFDKMRRHDCSVILVLLVGICSTRKRFARIQTDSAYKIELIIAQHISIDYVTHVVKTD